MGKAQRGIAEHGRGKPVRHWGASSRFGSGTLSSSRGPAVAEQQTMIEVSGATFGSTTMMGRRFSRTSSNGGQLSSQTIRPCLGTIRCGAGGFFATVDKEVWEPKSASGQRTCGRSLRLLPRRRLGQLPSFLLVRQASATLPDVVTGPRVLADEAPAAKGTAWRFQMPPQPQPPSIFATLEKTVRLFLYIAGSSRSSSSSRGRTTIRRSIISSSRAKTCNRYSPGLGKTRSVK